MVKSGQFTLSTHFIIPNYTVILSHHPFTLSNQLFAFSVDKTPVKDEQSAGLPKTPKEEPMPGAPVTPKEVEEGKKVCCNDK